MAAGRIVSGTEDGSAMDQGAGRKLNAATIAGRVGVFICSSQAMRRRDWDSTLRHETDTALGWFYLGGSTVKSGAPFGTISTAIAAADSVSLALSATVCSAPGGSKKLCPVWTS